MTTKEHAATSRLFSLSKLQAGEMTIHPAFDALKLVVSAGLHHGAATHEFAQGVLHMAFTIGVERAGGLIHHQDWRVAQQRAGDGDSLALTAHQRREGNE